MRDNEVTAAVVDAAVGIHMRFGPGLFESVYERILAFELVKRGPSVERQKPIPVVYESLHMEMGFRAGLLVEQRILVELKSVERVHGVHRKQVRTYLRVAGLRYGLLLNFGAELMKDGIFRIVNGY